MYLVLISISFGYQVTEKRRVSSIVLYQFTRLDDVGSSMHLYLVYLLGLLQLLGLYILFSFAARSIVSISLQMHFSRPGPSFRSRSKSELAMTLGVSFNVV